MEQEAVIDKNVMEGVDTSSQEEEEGGEGEGVEMVVQGPSLPPPSYVQEASNNAPPPVMQEPYNPAEPLTEPEPTVLQIDRNDEEKKREESAGVGVAPEGQRPYLGPTADYLGSNKEEQPVVSMPPPRRISKVSLS